MTDFETIIRGSIGIIGLILICYAFSSNRKEIKWKIVAKGLLIQMIFAILILKVPFVQSLFQGISNVFLAILDFTKSGSIFLISFFHLLKPPRCIRYDNIASL